MSFTQSDLDEVLNKMFSMSGIMALSWARKEDRGGVIRITAWRATYGSPYGPLAYTEAATPAGAIRAATAALVAARLTK